MEMSSLEFKINKGKLLPSCEEMIHKVVVDGDGTIIFKEFKMMMECSTWFFFSFIIISILVS